MINLCFDLPQISSKCDTSSNATPSLVSDAVHAQIYSFMHIPASISAKVAALTTVHISLPPSVCRISIFKSNCDFSYFSTKMTDLKMLRKFISISPSFLLFLTILCRSPFFENVANFTRTLNMNSSFFPELFEGCLGPDIEAITFVFPCRM